MTPSHISSILKLSEAIALETGNPEEIANVRKLREDVEKLEESKAILTSAVTLLHYMLPKTLEPFRHLPREEKALALYNSLTNEGATAESLSAMSADEGLAYAKRIALAAARRIVTANSIAVVI